MSLAEFRAETARLRELCHVAENRCAAAPGDERRLDEFEAAVSAYEAHSATRAEIREPARRTVRLAGGLTGYCMPAGRFFDCFRPAIATVLQVPLDEMPDPEIDARLEVAPGRESRERLSQEVIQVIDGWLRGRGLVMTYSDTPPVTRELWIAVVRPLAAVRAECDDELPFTDHCLVMARDRVIFEPAFTVPPPPGMRLRQWTRKDFRYAITFDSTQPEKAVPHALD